jgi:DNA-binding NtrC family response regulator
LAIDQIEGLRSRLLDGTETLFDAVLKYEGLLIAAALKAHDGKVTRAAIFLGMSYQALAYTIEHRHEELLGARSAIHRRSQR